MAKRIDVSNYQTWPKVLTPSGGVYYQVPNSGLVYDPVREIFYPNPKPALDEKKKQQDQIDENNSVGKQIIPTVAGAATTVGTLWAANQIGGGAAAAAPAAGAGTAAGTSAAVGTGAGTGTAAAGAGTATGAAFEAGATGGAASTGTAAVGTEGAVEGGVGLTGEAAAGYVGGPILGALWAYDTYKNRGGKQIIEGNASKSNYIDTALASNTFTFYINPALGALGMKSVGNTLAPASTAKMQRQRWQALVDAGIVDPWFAGFRGEGEAYGPNQDQGVSQKLLDSGKLKGEDVWATSGMFNVFGKDWLTVLDVDQRRRVAQQLLDEKLLRSDHGITDITDPSRALTIAAAVKRGDPIPPIGAPGGDVAAPAPAGTGTPGLPTNINKQPLTIQPGVNVPVPPAGRPTTVIAPTPLPQRSSTISPGIGLNGQRLTNQQMGKELARRMDRR